MSYEDKKMNSSEQLAFLREKGGIITQLSRSITTLSNGMPYYFVEFTSVDGSQYGIQAYGDEATELYTETMRTIGYVKEIPIPLILR
jgi:hypothetical protein